MWEFLGGLIGVGTAFWVGWPGYHPYLGQSEFYVFLTRHLAGVGLPSETIWFFLFWVTGAGQWATLLLSQNQRTNRWFVAGVRQRAFVSFVGALVWYFVFRLYLSDRVSGAAVVTSFTVAFAHAWTYLCLTVGHRQRAQRLLLQLDRELGVIEQQSPMKADATNVTLSTQSIRCRV